jgi:formimidoylglutamate deiminase
MHACEQRREIAESLQEYGKTPIAVFADLGLLGPHTTLVHGTHLSQDELALLGEFKPTIAACPTTERNLGDGFLPAAQLVAHNVPISLGTDSQATINLFEDMRLVEYHERLRHERRNVLATQVGRVTEQARISTGEVIFPMGTLNGARSLKLKAGRLAQGHLPDMIAVDLNHTSVRPDRPEDLHPEDLLDHITLSVDLRAVRPITV